MAKHRILGIDFSHMHMGDLLRQVGEHPAAEVVGALHHDSNTPREVLDRLGLPLSLIHTDWETCLAETQPTVAVLCAPTAQHCQWALKAAERGIHLLIEKPFASSVQEADSIIKAFQAAGKKLAINWPLAWYPVHRGAKQLVDEGLIGTLVNLHYYDGNRGPLFHAMDKIELDVKDPTLQKQESWFYQKDHGGGSLFDYLGYGSTLATWFNNGAMPLEITSVVDQPPGLEVDEHSVTVARYETGLYKFETRWGTFTDPWTHQPAPRCGFVLCGTEGTICSYDFADTLQVQTHSKPEGYEIPIASLDLANSNPISYFLRCIDEDLAVTGPLSPGISRAGQQIVDAAVESATTKRSIELDTATSATTSVA